MLIVNLVCQFGAQQWLSSGPYSDPDIATIRGFDNLPETSFPELKSVTVSHHNRIIKLRLSSRSTPIFRDDSELTPWNQN